MKLIKIIFFILFIQTQNLYNQEINHFDLAIKALKSGDIKRTKSYLNEIKYNNPEHQYEYIYIKIQYIIYIIDNDYFSAEQIYTLLENNDIDIFLLYLRILHLFHFNQYEKIKEILARIDFKSFKDFIDDEFTILPFSCDTSDFQNIFYNKLKNKRLDFLWRNQITSKEMQFLVHINHILNDKSDPQNFLLKCKNVLLDIDPHKYHIYRLFLYTKEDIYVYFNFYLFLLQHRKYIEALHILRAIYSKIPIKDFPYEFYIVMLSFKKIYEKLSYIKQVDSIERFLQILEKNHYKSIDLVELKKIATENRHLREFLWFLYQIETLEEKRNYYWKYIKEYDEIFDAKEKISYYKSIYSYP